MKRDLAKFPKLDSSFLSCEKDIETILRRLFIENKPYSEQLKRLLVINTKDCLDNMTSDIYINKMKEMTLPKLIEEGYVKIKPKIRFEEHSKIKSYVIIGFDNFLPNSTNPEFRDCEITFDVFCHIDYWDLGDYRLRPFKIMGIIDGLLNNTKLSGIGTVQFSGCSELVLDENLAGYTLTYSAIHMTDDRIPGED